jgi:hypothetical protein
MANDDGIKATSMLSSLMLTPEQVSALEQERSALDKAPADQAEEIFNDHLAAAALTICKIAIHDEDNKRRLDAAKYVVDRQLGRAVQKIAGLGREDPLVKFLSEVEAAANDAEQASQ